MRIFSTHTGRQRRSGQAGFTLIEMMVAVALFAVVMIISAGSLLALASANRKAQALQAVMNNLNVTVDGMVRSMRQGSTYHCGGGSITVPQDCTSGDTQVAFEQKGGGVGLGDQRLYRFVSSGGYIERSDNGGSDWVRITAPEITITDMQFFVVGTSVDSGDVIQPKVIVMIKGIAGGTNTKISTTFHIQATAVQRVLDL